MSDLFRAEAVEHHATPDPRPTEDHEAPRWLGPAVWVLLSLVVAAVAAFVLVRYQGQRLISVYLNLG